MLGPAGKSALWAALFASTALLTAATRASDARSGTVAEETFRESDGSVASAVKALAAVVTVARREAEGPDMTAAARRELLRASSEGTYIDELLLARDSALVRWPVRGRPLRVWIQDRTPVADFTPDRAVRVREAFQQWDSVGMTGLHFTFTPDSVGADVHVTWIDRFKEPISGRTRWARDDSWWITDASIVLAVHHQKGETLDADATRAIALHEVGHLIGLDHTSGEDCVMAARVRVRSLSEEDRATARLLYAVPAGRVR